MFKAVVDMGDLNSRGPSKSQIKFELRPQKKRERQIYERKHIIMINIAALTLAPAASILSRHSSRVSIIAEQLVGSWSN